MAGNTGQPNAPSAPARPRCLVLCAEPTPPAELTDGLRKRGMSVATVADAPQVMLQFARRPFAALVIVEPATIPACDALARAVPRYYPHTGCWAYTRDTDTTPRLTKLNGNGATSQLSSEPGHPRPRSERSSETPPTSSTSSDHPLVSPEELSMLLDADDEPVSLQAPATEGLPR